MQGTELENVNPLMRVGDMMYAASGQLFTEHSFKGQTDCGKQDARL